jgi:NAD(P)-dependent dehydrogenase (short-subunit alcohol dehydrogenase family)
VNRTVEVAHREFGSVDILVNNAGVNIRGTVGELSESDWDTVLDTNLKGVFLLSRAFGPAMCERRWGRVINLSSMLASIGLPGRAPYAASKAGVVGLTRVLALEWAASGVTVNAICPGPFATDMNRQLLNDPEKYAAFVQKLPVGRWGELHEIKGIVVFLASEASSFVTGAALAIDGGWTAQ